MGNGEEKYQLPITNYRLPNFFVNIVTYSKKYLQTPSIGVECLGFHHRHAIASMSQPSRRFSTIDPEAKAPTLKRLRQLSRLLDKAIIIPGTRVGIGLDPILGLIPVGGDFLGVMLSAYIILESARLGVPARTLGRMVFNIIIDGLAGTAPVLGDLFDFAWTANERNVRLLEEYLRFPSQNQSANKWFVFAVLIGLLFVAIVLVALPVIIMRLLWGTLTGS